MFVSETLRQGFSYVYMELAFVAAEADLHKLRHSLKILSETEKQLRISKNQTTWLTAALLQLSSIDSSSLDEHELKCCSRNIDDKGKECQNPFIFQILNSFLCVCMCMCMCEGVYVCLFVFICLNYLCLL